jgi:hypothetical protein
MVLAGQLDRIDHAFEAQLLDARAVRFEVLESPSGSCSPVKGLLPNFFIAVRIASVPIIELRMPRL